MTAPVVIVDIETTGLHPNVDQIWEVAAIRLFPDGNTLTYQTFVEHDRSLAERLPEKFRAQHDEVFADLAPIDNAKVRSNLVSMFTGGTDEKAIFVGACPWFDAAFLTNFLGFAPWHHRLRCVESMTAGHLGRNVGGLNDCLAELGLSPNRDAHRALADAEAAAAIWKHLTTKEER